MKTGYIPKDQRKTILFLADDCRLPSGIGTMTKELIIGSAHVYNFVHVGAGINHPDAGKILDISGDVNKEAEITDSSVIMYPYNGYGDPDLIRLLLRKHQIDAIVHFTDPRYWVWLYQMSAEIRQHVPIFYYHIWDDLPAPHYNKPFYESCDLLMGISKQSVNISRLVLGEGQYVDLNDQTSTKDIASNLPKVCYVPHGINSKYLFPRDKQDPKVKLFRHKLFNGDNPEYVILHNNRNIRRKMTSDVVVAFKVFMDSKKESEREGIRLVLHTQPIDENGTDLYAVIDTLTPEYKDKIIFTNARLSPEDLNLLYNSCDVVINIASNEGWGLSSTEAMMCAKPIINNVTGGLQDQCRFEDESKKWIEFDTKFTTNHTGKYKVCGKWAYPVFPTAINVQGSIPTPYIFDDRCDIRDVAKAMNYWYSEEDKGRETCGKAGYDWVMSEESGMSAANMCNSFIKYTGQVLDNWKQPARFTLFSIKDEIQKLKNRNTGIMLSYE